MKALILSLSIVLGLCFGGVAMAFDPFTDTGTCQPGSSATVCKENENSGGQTTTSNRLYGPDGVITKAVRIVSLFVGVASVIVIIISGIILATSSGDSAKLTQARNAITYAIVGIVVTVFSQGIIIFVLNKL